MAAPQIRGLAGDIKAIREEMRKTLEAVRSDAAMASSEFGDAVTMVRADIKDIRDATAELRGEVAQGSNGGPSLSSPPSPNGDVPLPPATETRAQNFSDLHPSNRRQNF